MQNAHNLTVFGEAKALAVAVYRLTADLPANERFGLVPQMRRAAISIGSNIAEGCGRSGARALLPFLHYAIGSSNELAFQVEIAVDLGHCSAEEAADVITRVVRTRRMLIRLAAVVARRSVRNRESSPTTHHSRLTTRGSSPTRAPARHV